MTSIKVPPVVARAIRDGEFGRPAVIFKCDPRTGRFDSVWTGTFLECIPEVVRLRELNDGFVYNWAFDDV